MRERFVITKHFFNDNLCEIFKKRFEVVVEGRMHSFSLVFDVDHRKLIRKFEYLKLFTRNF